MRPGPHQIDTTGASDGDALLYDSATDEYRPTPVAVGTVVRSIVAGENIDVDDTDPDNPIVSAVLLMPLTTEIGGVPDLVWDSDNQLVLTEAL